MIQFLIQIKLLSQKKKNYFKESKKEELKFVGPFGNVIQFQIEANWLIFQI